jgi:hypothetical protein
MRMSEYDYPISYWVNLFSELYEKGVKVHHVSSEYVSFHIYCIVLREFYSIFPKRKIKHIVKLAEPHFDSIKFNSGVLLKKVNEYRQALLVDNELFGIQWMWRGDLADDNLRCKQFENSGIQIRDSISFLKSQRIIDKFYIFPYTTRFARVVLKMEDICQDFFDGFIVYRNYMELEYDSILDDSNKSNLILRPLNSGKTLIDKSVKDSFSFAISHKNVIGGIISISSISKLNEIYGI